MNNSVLEYRENTMQNIFVNSFKQIKVVLQKVTPPGGKNTAVSERDKFKYYAV